MKRKERVAKKKKLQKKKLLEMRKQENAERKLEKSAKDKRKPFLRVNNDILLANLKRLKELEANND